MKPLVVISVLSAAAMAAEPVLPSWDTAKTEDPVSENTEAIILPPGEGNDNSESTPELELPGNPPEESPTSGSAYSELPEEYWSAYFGEKPGSFLIDPQRLLAPVVYRERLDFLNYHSSDSGIDLYVYLFAGDQEIPTEVREEELMERHFADRNAAVVFYYLGAPQRAALKLPPALAAKIPATETRRALENPVIHASKEFDPARQLEVFLMQMSIRLYWLETLLHDEASNQQAGAKPKVLKQPQASPGIYEFVSPYIESARPHFPHALASAGSLLAVCAALWWVKRRARFRFPDLEVEPRLGGAHAAGVGAVISFASATVPPASQRARG